MKPKNSWERAFPSGHETYTPKSGLTKREYFAGLALQGLSAQLHKWTGFEEELADELLEALEK